MDARSSQLDGKWDAIQSPADQVGHRRLVDIEVKVRVCQPGAIQEQGGGIGRHEGGDPPDRLAGHAQGLSAGHQHVKLRAAPEKLVGQVGRRLDHVLAAVQDQQRPPALEVCGE